MFPDIADLHDVRMCEFDQRTGLASKSRRKFSILQHRGVRGLDDHVRAEIVVPRTENGPHASFANLGVHSITPVSQLMAHPHRDLSSAHALGSEFQEMRDLDWCTGYHRPLGSSISRNLSEFSN